MKLRKNIIAMIALTLTITLLSTSTILANDYAGNEAYYNDFCSSSSAQTESGKVTCRGYNQYLSDKAQNSSDEAAKYKGKMEEYAGDLAKQVELAEEFQGMIDNYNSEIVELEGNIVRLEANIETIEREIEAREDEINEKDRIIVERMKKTQFDMRFGYEIDFLFQSKDFASLLASFSVVSDIMEFEAVQIKEINELIEQQKVDQDLLVVQQETIALNIASIEESKKQAQVLKAEVDVAVANYQTLMAEMDALQAQASADSNAIRNQIQANLDAMNTETIIPSGGFIRPVSGGYLSATVWSYPAPWNAVHLGNDYAFGQSVGAPIMSVANGVVIGSSGGCPTWGYLGNYCGGILSGGGNQVHTLVSVDGSLYGVIYLHMQEGSPIASGSVISQGQTIGRIGTSGNSTGPHTHVEVYYLGGETITDYLARWNGNYLHGIGMSLANRCIDNGYSSPCRMDPREVLGYS